MLIAGILALLAGVLLAPGALAAGRVAGANNGEIDGTLVDGTTNGTPIAGQTVTLMTGLDSGQRAVATAVTDAHGLFRFTGLATDQATVYVATTQYQGAPYHTDPLSLAGDPTLRVTLLTYEATSSDAQIGLGRVVIQLQVPNVLAGTIGVTELVAVVNGGQRTYVGTPGAAAGKPMNLLRFPLPPGAGDLVPATGFAGAQLIQVDRGFATTLAIPPGETDLAFSFSYPYDGTHSTFPYEVLYPTAQVAVLAPGNMTLSAPALGAQQSVALHGGAQLHVLQGGAFLAGTNLAIQLAQLPVPGQPSDYNLALLYGLVAVLAVVAVVAVGYHLKRNEASLALAWLAHAGQPRRAGRRSTHTVARLTDPAAERVDSEQLLATLAKLDRAHEAGKLEDEIYRAQREALKARLKTLMLAEAGASSGAPGGGQ
jgi:hypothetical protein